MAGHAGNPKPDFLFPTACTGLTVDASSSGGLRKKSEENYLFCSEELCDGLCDCVKNLNGILPRVIEKLPILLLRSCSTSSGSP